MHKPIVFYKYLIKLAQVISWNIGNYFNKKNYDILYIDNEFYFLPTHFYILNKNDIRISGKQIKLTIDRIDKNKVIEKKITRSVFILDINTDTFIFKLQNYFILEKLSRKISINNFDR